MLLRHESLDSDRENRSRRKVAPILLMVLLNVKTCATDRVIGLDVSGTRRRPSSGPLTVVTMNSESAMADVEYAVR